MFKGVLDPSVREIRPPRALWEVNNLRSRPKIRPAVEVEVVGSSRVGDEHLKADGLADIRDQHGSRRIKQKKGLAADDHGRLIDVHRLGERRGARPIRQSDEKIRRDSDSAGVLARGVLRNRAQVVSQVH